MSLRGLGRKEKRDHSTGFNSLRVFPRFGPRVRSIPRFQRGSGLLGRDTLLYPRFLPAPSSLASDACRDPGAAWPSGRRPWMLLSVPSTPGSWDSALPPAGLLSQSLFPAPPCSRIPAFAVPWEAAGPSIPARGGNRSPGSRRGVRSLPLGVPGFWLAQVVPPLVLSIRTIPRISRDSLPAFPGLRSAALALAGWHRRYSRGIFPTPLLAPCFRGVF